MSNAPDLSKLIGGADDVLRQAIEKAYAQGVEDERARLRKLLNGEEQEHPTAESPESDDQENPVTNGTGSYAEYGAITNPVRTALLAIGNRPNGVGATDISEHLKGRYNQEITLGQIRDALKMLARQEEAVRVSRGMYRATHKLEKFVVSNGMQRAMI